MKIELRQMKMKGRGGGNVLVVLEDGQLNLLLLVVDLLGGGVHLLLPLLTTTTEAEDKVEGRLLLDVVVRKGAAILELLAGEDQTLLVGGDALLVLDLLLDILDGVGRLNLEGDSLTREGLDEDLHGSPLNNAEDADGRGGKERKRASRAELGKIIARHIRL
jgi:hypothetical protein